MSINIHRTISPVFFLSLTALFLFAHISGFAQTKPDTAQKVVVLERAGEVRGGDIRPDPTDSTKRESVRFAIGNVRFVEATTTLECDTATQYLASRKIRLVGNIVIVRDTVTIRGYEGFYFPDERKSVLEKNVSLTDQKVFLNSQHGIYFSDEKKAIFNEKVSMKDSSNLIFSDSLIYFRPDARSVLIGRVKIENPTDNVVITGGYAEHFTNDAYSFITEKPVFVKIDTSESGKVDTLIIRSNRMDAYRSERDTLKRIDITDSVRIRRGTLLSRSARAKYLIKKKVITLSGNPIIWYENNQITGDSMAIVLKESGGASRKSQVDKIYVYQRAFLTSRDTLDKSGKKFSQISGERMVITFDDSANIRRADFYKQARSLYYRYDDQKPKGANLSSGDEITIAFRKNQLTRITFRGGVEGAQYPERFLGKQDLNLPGFKWRESEKPKE
jgi:lipopolysaccharide export system protein LptA